VNWNHYLSSAFKIIPNRSNSNSYDSQNVEPSYSFDSNGIRFVLFHSIGSTNAINPRAASYIINKENSSSLIHPHMSLIAASDGLICTPPESQTIWTHATPLTHRFPCLNVCIQCHIIALELLSYAPSHLNWWFANSYPPFTESSFPFAQAYLQMLE